MTELEKVKSRLKRNVILFTKNGKRIGNAIIVDKFGEGYTIKTDYGNEVCMSATEIIALFTPDFLNENLHDSQIQYLREGHKYFKK